MRQFHEAISPFDELHRVSDLQHEHLSRVILTDPNTEESSYVTDQKPSPCQKCSPSPKASRRCQNPNAQQNIDTNDFCAVLPLPNEHGKTTPATSKDFNDLDFGAMHRGIADLIGMKKLTTAHLL